MDPIYIDLKRRANEIIAQYPPVDFHTDYSWATERSSEMLYGNLIVSELLDFVTHHIDDDFGHGLDHSVRVSIDAGALILIDGINLKLSEQEIKRLLLLVQCASLLHDFKRKEINHSIAGAKFAKTFLKSFTLSSDEIRCISQAIRNHEAFKPVIVADMISWELISDSLYDADKFRWGPDNFARTLWDMVDFHNTPISVFVSNFQKGMAFIAKVKSTFRSATGKKYGPLFIDRGILIGEELYRIMRSDFGLY
jgi:hypothetical protein